MKKKEPISLRLGNLIKWKRKVGSCSIAKLARFTDISQAILINIEKGKHKVGITTLNRLSSFLHFSQEDFKELFELDN